MPPKNDKDRLKRTTKQLNSKWLQNTLKSMGVASVAAVSEVMPTTADTIKNVSGTIKESINSVKTNRVNGETLSNQLKNNKMVKMGEDFFKNAVQDIKSGELYNTSREDDGGMFDDMETMFDDLDDILDDNGNIDTVQVENNIVAGNTVDETGRATLAAINTQSRHQIQSSKATIDAMVSINSNAMMQNLEISSKVLNKLDTINSNLAAIVEYNNTNMTKLIEASIGYFDQMRTADEDDSSSDNVSATDIYSSNGALDIGNYIQYVKGNIANNQYAGMIKMVTDLLTDDMMRQQIISNPIGLILTNSIKAIIPSATKHVMAALDESMKDFIPVMLERISGLGEGNNTTVGKTLRTIGSILGVSTNRSTLDTRSGLKNGPVSYNGVADETIVEIIPKYLRESNTYLKEIAESITGKSKDEMSKGFTSFDWGTGRFVDMDKKKANIYGQINDLVMGDYEKSKIGKKLDSAKSLLTDDADLEAFDNAKNRLYRNIHRVDGEIDFTDPETIKSLADVKSTKNIQNLFRAILEKAYEDKDELIGNIKHTKIKARRTESQAMKDVERSANINGMRDVVESEAYDDWVDRQLGSNASTVIKKYPNGVKRVVNASKIDMTDGERVAYKTAADSESRKSILNYIKDQRANAKVKDFKDQLTQSDSDAEVSDFDDNDYALGTDNKTVNTVNKPFKAVAGILNRIMAGDSDGAWDALIAGIQEKFKVIGAKISENFFKPIKNALFGEKDDNGYLHGGMFEGVNNKLKESFFSFRRLITGKGYTDSEGNQVADANDEEMKNTVVGKFKSIATGIRESVRVKLFGKEAETDKDGNVVEDEKEGILGKFKHKMGGISNVIYRGMAGWKEALFGKNKDDEDKSPEEIGKQALSDFKKSATDKLPSAIVGGALGGLTGIATGGLLGAIVSGPVGAMLGMTTGILSRSEKFKSWLFGKENEDGTYKEGVIKQSTQQWFKDNGKYIAGGGAIGLAKGVLLGGGVLGGLVGGPIGGAIMGIGTSMLIKSDMFQKFLFGDEEAGKAGLVGSIKRMFSNMGKNKKGDASSGKLLGMAGIGTAVGTLSGAMIGKMGLLGALTFGGITGPLGGALVGLGAAILAQKNNFKEWLFGTVDPDTGARKAGLIGKFGNMLTVHVFRPMGRNFANIGRDFKSFLYHDVLEKFRLGMEPIINTITAPFKRIGAIAGAAVKNFGSYIKENFLDNLVDGAKKILAPMAKAFNSVTTGIYKVGKTIVGAPFKILYSLTSPVVQAVNKAVSGTFKFIGSAINNVIIKPVNTLLVKPITKIVKTTGKIIAAPFKIITKTVDVVTNFVKEKMDLVSRFLHIVGTDIKKKITKIIFAPFRKAANQLKRVKNIIVDFTKILVSPITEFVKTSITEVKNSIKRRVNKVFHYLNPITWIKGAVNLLRGKKSEGRDGAPKHEGYIARAWRRAKNGEMPDHTGETLTNSKERAYNNYSRKHGRQQKYYTDENGNKYYSAAGGQYFKVFDKDDKELDPISAKELPKGSKLHLTGQNGKEYNRQKRREDKLRGKNEATIFKYSKGSLTDDTEQNRAIVAGMMAKAGKGTPTWNGISATDKEKNQIEARIREKKDKREENIEKNGEKQTSILGKIHDTLDDLRVSLTGTKEEKQERKTLRDNQAAEDRKKKLAEHEKAKVKHLIDFYDRGYTGPDISADELEQQEKMASQRAKSQANYQTDGKKNEHLRKKDKHYIDDKYAEETNHQMRDNFTKHGLFGGLKANFKVLKSQILSGTKGVSNFYKNNDDIPKYAKGTSNAKKGFALVGEKGPEVVYMNGGEKVVPNNKLNPHGMTSKLTDSNLLDVSDTNNSKLSIQERLLRETLNIEGILDGESKRKKGSKKPKHRIKFKYANGMFNDDDAEEKTDASTEDTETGDKPKKVKVTKKTNASVKDVANTAKNGLEDVASKITFGIGDIIKKDEEKKEDEEFVEKNKEAESQVETFTGAHLRDIAVEKKEEDEDDAREDKQTSLLQRLADKFSQHHDVWSSIFSKKGLITGGLIVLAPLVIGLIRKLMGGDGTGSILGTLISLVQGIATGIQNVISFFTPVFTTIADTIKNILDRIKWTDEHDARDDGNSAGEQFLDDVTDLVDGNILTDSEGNATHNTDSRMSVLRRFIMNFINSEHINPLSSKYTKDQKKFFNSIKEFFGSFSPDDAASAAVNSVDDVGASVAGAAVNSVDDVGASVAGAAVNSVDNIAGAAVNSVDNIGGALLNQSDNVAKTIVDAAGNVIIQDGSDIVSTVASATVTESKNGKLFSKVSTVIDDFFDFIKKKFAAKAGKELAEEGIEKCSKKTLLRTLSNNWTKFCEKCGAKIVGEGGAKTAGAVISFGVSELVFASIGAANGVSGTAKLFNVNKDKIDGTMRTIAGIFGALAGTTVGGIIDVIVSFVGGILGFDFLNALAVALYNQMANIDDVRSLEEAEIAFKQQYLDERDVLLADQLKTQQDAGIIGQDVSLDDYKTGISDGTYSASYKSFDNWNTEQNASFSDKTASFIGKTFKGDGGLLDQGKQLAGTVFGSSEVTYSDSRGNTYKQNKDGTYQVTGPDGKDLGYINKDALPEDIEKHEEKKDGLIQNVQQGDFNGVAKNVGSMSKKLLDIAIGKSLFTSIFNAIFGKTEFGMAIKDVSDQLSANDEALSTLAFAGDIGGLTAYEFNAADTTSESLVGVVKAAAGIQKLFTYPTAAMMWVGKRVGKSFGKVISVAKKVVPDMLSNESSIASAALKGDVEGMWKAPIKISDDDPITWIPSVTGVISKLVKTPPAAMVWVGKHIFKGVSHVVKDMGAAITAISKSNSTLQDAFEKGVSDDYFTADTNTLDEDNMFYGIASGIMGLQKPFVFVSNVFRALGKSLGKTIGKVVNKIKPGVFDIARNELDLVGKSFSGDIVGLWTHETKVSEDNPLGWLPYVTSFISKLVKTPRTALFWLGGKIIDNIGPFISDAMKAMPDIISNEKVVFNKAVTGDIVGMWTHNARVSEKNPVGWVPEVTNVISKIIHTPVAAMIWTGRTIKDGFVNFVSGAKTAITDIAANEGNLINYVVSGDITGLWDSETQVSEDNPVGWLPYATTFIAKITHTVPTAFFWLGGKIKEKLQPFIDGAKTLFSDIGENEKEIGELTLAGDPSGIWKKDTAISENNPIGWLPYVTTFVSKITHTIPSAIFWVGHKVSDFMGGIVDKIKNQFKGLDEAITKPFEFVDDGDLDGLSKYETKVDKNAPMSGMISVVGSICKIIAYPITAISKVFHKVSDFIKNFKFSDILDDIMKWANDENKDDGGNGTGIGGNGRGTKTITGGSGTGTKVIDSDPQKLNGGTYYSQNDEKWRNMKYVRSDGTDDGATIGTSGCGPTAMSMAISDITKKKVKPTDLASYAQKDGTRDETGTNWNFVDDSSQAYGLSATRKANPTVQVIDAALSSGKPIVLAGQDDGSGTSPYTTAGHYVVVTGKDRHGNLLVNDPRGAEYSGRMSPQRVVRSTNMAWTFNRGGHGTGRKRRGYGRGNQGGYGVNRSQWISIIKEVKSAIAEQFNANSSYEYLSPKYITLNLDNKEIKVRTDCTGMIEACLKYYGVMDASAGLSSAEAANSSSAVMSGCGFTSSPFTSLDSLTEGDILARNGHAEIFARYEGGKLYVYNGGSTKALRSPDCTQASDKSYQTVWHPGSAGSGAISGSANSSTSATPSTSGSSSGTNDILSQMTAGMNAIGTKLLDDSLTGNYDSSTWRSVIESAMSSGSTDTSSSSTTGLTGATISAGSSTGSAITGDIIDAAHRKDPRSGYTKLTLDQLKAAIRSVAGNGTSLEAKADQIIEASAATGIDPRWITAFAAQESGWNGSKYSNQRQNYFGITAYGENPDMATTFNGNGFTAGIKWMLDHYFAKGQTSFRLFANPAEAGVASYHEYNDGDFKSYAKIYANLIKASTGTGSFGKGVVEGGSGELPYYSQNDPKWKNKKYVRSDGIDDGATMGTSGCGPAAMSMVLSEETNKNINPTDLASYAQKSGNRDDSGTNSNFIDSSSRAYGVNSVRNIAPSGKYIKNQVKNGPMVLLGRDDGSGTSPYTTAGHYVVASNAGNGKVNISDPRGKEYNRSVDADSLSGNTGMSWSFNRGGHGKSTVPTSLASTVAANRTAMGNPISVQTFSSFTGTMSQAEMERLRKTFPKVFGSCKTIAECVSSLIANTSSVFSATMSNVAKTRILKALAKTLCNYNYVGLTSTDIAELKKITLHMGNSTSSPFNNCTTVDMCFNAFVKYARTILGSDSARAKGVVKALSMGDISNSESNSTGEATNGDSGSLSSGGDRQAWLAVCKAVKEKMASMNLTYSQSGSTISFELDGHKVTCRPDCTGWIHGALQIFVGMSSSVYINSGQLVQSDNSDMIGAGFTYKAYTSADDLLPGDIVAGNPSVGSKHHHGEVYVLHDGGKPQVYNGGSTEALGNPSYQNMSYPTDYKAVWQPGSGTGVSDSGGSASEGNASFLSFAMEKIGQFASGLLEATLTGDLSKSWEDILSGDYTPVSGSSISSGTDTGADSTSVDGSGSGSSLSGNSTKQKIWNYFTGRGVSKAATAGIMGNMQHESGFEPKNLQNSYEKSLGMDDDAYTSAVDSGSYSENKFVNDKAGYGLIQWTYNTLKQGLYKNKKAKGTSIGDLGMQLDQVYTDLKSASPSTFSADTPTGASTHMLTEYERPAKMEQQKQPRAQTAESIYKEFAGGNGFGIGGFGDENSAVATANAKKHIDDKNRGRRSMHISIPALDYNQSIPANKIRDYISKRYVMGGHGNYIKDSYDRYINGGYGTAIGDSPELTGTSSLINGYVPDTPIDTSTIENNNPSISNVKYLSNVNNNSSNKPDAINPIKSEIRTSTFNNNTSMSYADSDVVDTLNKILNVLSTISGNSDKLSTLNDINTNLKNMGNTSITTNKTVNNTNNNASRGSNTPQKQQTSSNKSMSSSEQIARRIAFGR